jgi:Ca2+-binding RTX toxin-like protein
MRAWGPAAAVVLAVAAGAPTAHAAAVSVTRSSITFEAAAGEENRVAVTTAPGVFRITDLGAPIDVGFGCRRLGAQTVECERRGVERLTVRVGDRNDTVTASVGVPTVLAGGEGDDLIEGTEGDDTMRGGPGADTLLGGDGFDTLGGGPGADVLSGGTDAGRREIPLELDLVSYTGTTGGVRVSLDGVADDGEPGEGDNVLPDVEIAVGGRGPDTLIGNAEFLNALAGGGGGDTLLGLGGEIDVLFGEKGDDEIRGGAGEDLVNGGRGDDRVRGGVGRDDVEGGPGRDALAGGPSDDILVARDGEPDVVVGGPGRDLASVDREDAVFGIEVLRRPGLPAPTVTGRAARAAVRSALSRAGD